MKKRRILGIDPGSYFLGIGCVEYTDRASRLIFAEVIEAPKGLPLYSRFALILNRLKGRVDELLPDEVAFEDTFFGKNPRSALLLGMARGLVASVFLERKIPIFEYAPAAVKSAVAGNGRADKEAIKKMVEITLGTKINLGFDATDALAIAVCHGSQRRINQILSTK